MAALAERLQKMTKYAEEHAQLDALQAQIKALEMKAVEDRDTITKATAQAETQKTVHDAAIATLMAKMQETKGELEKTANNALTQSEKHKKELDAQSAANERLTEENRGLIATVSRLKAESKAAIERAELSHKQLATLEQSAVQQQSTEMMGLKQELAALKELLLKTETEGKQSQRELKENIAKHTATSHQLEETLKQLRAANETISELRESAKTLEVKLAAQANDAATLRKQLDETVEALQIKSSACSDLQDKQKGLEERLRESESKAKKLEEQLKERGTAASNFQKDADSMQTQLASLEQDKKLLQEQVIALETKIAEYQKTVTQSDQDIAGLKTELEQERLVLNQTQKEVTHEKEAVQTLQNKYGLLELELTSVKQELAARSLEYQQLDKEKKELDKDKQRLEEQLTSMSKEKHAMKETKAKIEAEYLQAQTEVAMLKTTKLRLEEDIVVRTKAQQQFESMLAALQKDKAALKDEVEKLKIDKEAAAIQIDKLVQETTTLSNLNNKLKEEVTAMAQQKANAEINLEKEHAMKAAALQHTVNELNQELTALRADKKREGAALTDTIAQKDAELHTLLQNKLAKEEQLNKLENEAKLHRTHMVSKEAIIATLEFSLSEQTSKTTALERELEGLKECQRQIEVLQSENTELKTQLVHEVSVVAMHQQELKQKNDELKLAAIEVERSKEHLPLLLEQNQSLRTEVGQLKGVLLELQSRTQNKAEDLVKTSANDTTKSSSKPNILEEMNSYLREILLVYKTVENVMRELLQALNEKEEKARIWMQTEEHIKKMPKKDAQILALKNLRDVSAPYLKVIPLKTDNLKTLLQCLAVTAKDKTQKLSQYAEEVTKYQQLLTIAQEKYLTYEKKLAAYEAPSAL